jgi:hypothetical protein
MCRRRRAGLRHVLHIKIAILRILNAKNHFPFLNFPCGKSNFGYATELPAVIKTAATESQPCPLTKINFTLLFASPPPPR